MGQEKVEIVATARDQASAVLKRLKTNVAAVGGKGRGPLGSLMSGIGGVSPLALGAAVGVGVLTGALADGVAGALEEEKQLVRLGQALKNNVRDWNGSTEAMENAAGAAMDLAFSDDAARESLIKLLPATKNEAEAIKLMNLAMNVARGRNIDLAAATDIVIKAHMGNVGALRRVGIAIDKNATSTEIVAHLTRVYAGNADAYAKTTAGKFEAAQVKVDNAMEDVGHELITVTAGFLSHSDAMKGDTEAAQDFLHAGSTLIPFFDLLGDAVGDATTTTLEFGAEVRRLPKAVADGLEDGVRDNASRYRRAGDSLLHEFFMTDWREEAEKKAKQFSSVFTDDLAGSLRGNRNFVKELMKDVNWAINHPKALERQLGKLQTALDSPKLRALLESDNPMQQAIGRQIQLQLTGQWEGLTGTKYDQGVSSIVGAIRSLRGSLNPGSRSRSPYGPSRLHGQDYTQYAEGGYMSPGEIGLVGERGPELIRAGRQGATITPNHALGVAPHTHPIFIGRRQVFEAMDEEMGRRLSRTPAGVVNRG